MAKANLSVLFLDLQGKVGNVVFRKTKDGIVVAPRSRNTNPQTPAQQIVRSAFTSATRQWRNLTPAQVQAWENFANNSSYSYDSAFTAWMQLSTKWILAHGGNGFAPTTPPTTEFWGDNLEINVTVKTGALFFSANRANSNNVVTEILWQPLSSQNRRPQSRGYRTGAYFAFRTGNMSTSISVPAGWYAAGYRFVNMATGQVSNFFPLNVPGPVAFSVATSNNSTSTTRTRNSSTSSTNRKSVSAKSSARKSTKSTTKRSSTSKTTMNNSKSNSNWNSNNSTTPSTSPSFNSTNSSKTSTPKSNIKSKSMNKRTSSTTSTKSNIKSTTKPTTTFKKKAA